MYSFSPLVDPNQVHHGYDTYVVLATLFVVACLAWATIKRDRATCRVVLIDIVVTLLLGMVIRYFSYMEQPAPRNEKVVATFVGTTAESDTRSTGKSHTTDHFLYGTFRTPDGLVVLRISPGVAIPEQVFLYKN